MSFSSLKGAALALGRGEKVARLALQRSEDLKCKNIMCGKLDEACVCKLARYVAQTPLAALEELDLSGNAIDVVPSSVFTCLPSLSVLTLRGNRLGAVSDEVKGLRELRHLDLSDNPVTSLPFAALDELPHLVSVNLAGSPIAVRSSLQRG